MSSWDHGEVLQLKTHGNEYARRVWLGNAPAPGEGGRPREGDDINVFKRFVVDAYENKRYYKEPAEGESYEVEQTTIVRPRSGVKSAGRTITSHKPNVALQASVFHAPAAPLRPPQPVAAPVPVAAPEVDLLDFGAFDSAPLSNNAPPPNAHVQPATSAPVANDVFDPFNTNAPATAPAPMAHVANNQMQMTANQPSGGFGDASFDPFGTMSTNPQPAPTAAAPVMNPPMMNNNSGMMGGMNNSMMNGSMNNTMVGMGNNMMNGMNNNMMQNQMQPNNMMNGMPANNMMMNNMMPNNMGMGNNFMMNGNMMNNQMGMMNNMNNNMVNGSMGTPNSGVHKTMPTTQAMNMNIMQPNNNSISNNFGAKPADSGKKDPFAGLGF